jgi:hypothetical protein
VFRHDSSTVSDTGASGVFGAVVETLAADDEVGDPELSPEQADDPQINASTAMIRSDVM